MFAKLFAESGLSLDRLKTLLEVAAAGSIVKAADADPVRQSQFSRQIKELEDFFRTSLIERQGKGTRLTPAGKELARISRFFMMGLSNFQRGCLAEEQVFRIGAPATFIQYLLLPALFRQSGVAHRFYATEVSVDDKVERCLHDLTLDFGVVNRAVLSRPLQGKKIGDWQLELWVPRALGLDPKEATHALHKGELPLALATQEIAGLALPSISKLEPRLACESFLEAKVALDTQSVATFIPGFLAPEKPGKAFFQVRLPEIESQMFSHYLAWNPRLMRLNPHASRRRDLLLELLTAAMPGQRKK